MRGICGRMGWLRRGMRGGCPCMGEDEDEWSEPKEEGQEERERARINLGLGRSGRVSRRVMLRWLS